MEQQKISRKELHNMVWETPFTTLSQKYNISDNGLRKTCIRLNIPYPKAGHWQKIKFGKKSPKTPLKKDMHVDQYITLSLRAVGEPYQPADERTPLQCILSEIEATIAQHLVVVPHLKEPIELVSALGNYLSKQEPDKWNYIGMVGSTRSLLDTKVHVKTIQRALIFWNMFINALRARGHDVIIKYSRTYAVLGESEFSLVMREKSTKEIYKDNNWEQTRYQPTGVLSLQHDSYPRKDWKDGKLQSLEQQISKIIAYLEIEAAREKADRIRYQEQENKRKEQERILAEYEQLKEAELIAFKETLLKASRWHLANNLRSYIAEVKKHATAKDQLSEPLKEWLIWAHLKADWYDPFIEREDELLADVDRDDLDEADDVPVSKKTYPYSLLEKHNSYFASRWKNMYKKRT